MKKKKIIIYIVMLTVIVFIIIELLPNKTTLDKLSNNGIYELNKVKLGDYKQTILVRGYDKHNPIIVFIHGGPGFASISYIKKYHSQIEKNYIVVNWDQRGAGKSYSPFLDKKTMSEKQILDDLDQLINYLCKEYNKEKIYIVGHSWGTVLAKDYVQKNPEKVESYISIGQYVSEKDSNIYSYNYLLNESAKRNDEKTLKKLRDLGSPPYDGNIKKEIILRKCINEYDGDEISVNINKEMLMGTITEPEYSILDLFKLFIGNYYSVYHLNDDYSNRDFRNENLIFEIPVTFIIGANDLVTNFMLAEEYFELIECNCKTLFWFDNSAHDPQYEELEKFNEIIKNVF